MIHFISKKEIDAAKIVIIWELGKLGGQVLGFRGQGGRGRSIIHNQMVIKTNNEAVLKVFLEGAFAKRPYITYSKSD